MTIDEVKKQLASGTLQPDLSNVIETCTLQSGDGKTCSGAIHLGWDIAKAWMCDQHWGTFNVQLMRFIQVQNCNEEQLKKVLASIQVDDAHWRWFDKSLHYINNEYVWFFLMAENYVQGACLLYHPKASVFSQGNIFYIEYVAVAPWNRVNPMSAKAFKGIGSALIRAAAHYATSVLKLAPGFCLHALPKAIKYYEDVGMSPHPPYDKGGLPYFEIVEPHFSKFLNEAQA